MENNKKTAPEIRFPGFTDPWEQRKLGDIVDRVTRKNANNVSELPLTISAQYGLIDQMEFFGKRIASRDISGYYLLYQGEFAYNKSTSGDAPWGAVKRLDRYENGAVSTLYITFAIKDSDQTDSDFLACYYDTDLWHKGVQAVAAEGARNHGLLNIAPADFFNTTLMMPSNIEEQKAIGSVLNKVDNLIALHQCEYYHSQTDNCKGQNISNYRCNASVWEQRKLSEIAEKVTQKNTEMKYKETLTNSAEHGIINQTDFFDKEISNADKIDGYYIVDHDDFVYNPRISSLAPVGPINRNKLNRSGVMSPLYTVFRTHDINTLYLEWFFKSDTWHSFMMFNGDSGARSDRFSIRNDLFFTMPISVPSKEEQALIGAFFEQADATITLHQCEYYQFQTGNRKGQIILIYRCNTSTWEQRKVGEIANKTFGGGTPKTNVPEYWNGNIPWIQSSNLSEHQLFDVDIQKHITSDGLQKSATQLVPKNSIAVVSHVGVGKLVFMPFEYTTSQDFISLADLNTDPTFSCYALYKKLQDDLHIVQGSAIKGITKEVLLNKEISVPEFAEQKKIGEFLRSVDNLITLHQRNN